MNSIFYQSEVLYLSPSGSEEVLVPNVQSANWSFSSQGRREVGSLGRFSSKYYRPLPQDPLVNLSVEIFPSGSEIENALGLLGPVSVIDYLVSGEQKYYDLNAKLLISEMVGGGSKFATVNFTSGVLTNYSFQASVNELPRTSFSLEFLDCGIDVSSSFVRPLLEDFKPVIQSQDIVAKFPTGIFGVVSGGFYLQNFSVSLGLPRSPITEIGSSKPVLRHLQSPINAQFQMSALVKEFAATTPVSGSGSAASGNSLEMFRQTRGEPINGDIKVEIYQPASNGGPKTKIMTHVFSKPYLEEVSYGNSLGGYTTIDLSFTTQVTFENIAGISNYKITTS